MAAGKANSYRRGVNALPGAVQDLSSGSECSLGVSPAHAAIHSFRLAIFARRSRPATEGGLQRAADCRQPLHAESRIVQYAIAAVRKILQVMKQSKQNNPLPLPSRVKGVKVETPSIQSLDRGLLILDTVGKARAPVSLGQLTEVFGIDRSSVFRLANTLKRRGYLANPSSGKEYILGHSCPRRQII